jgi:hypothetical protein
MERVSYTEKPAESWSQLWSEITLDDARVKGKIK